MCVVNTFCRRQRKEIFRKSVEKISMKFENHFFLLLITAVACQTVTRIQHAADHHEMSWDFRWKAFIGIFRLLRLSHRFSRLQNFHSERKRNFMRPEMKRQMENQRYFLFFHSLKQKPFPISCLQSVNMERRRLCNAVFRRIACCSQLIRIEIEITCFPKKENIYFNSTSPTQKHSARTLSIFIRDWQRADVSS